MRVEDLTIDIFRPPNSGVNSHSTAIRITHRPTGLKAESWRHKTLAMNRKTAWHELERLIAELEKETG